jgi:8-oxo-dGTP pyrophosphatase MutT (NUDIX family)
LKTPAQRSDLKERILASLQGTRPATDPVAAAYALLPPAIATHFARPLIAAAVLVPLVEREPGLTVLLTQRADHLRDHPGQVSFPGGRIAAGDESPLAAALREAGEELGITAGLVEVAGYLPPQPVITGFALTPVVGFLPASVVFTPDPVEVAEVFEVPLDFVLDSESAISGMRRVNGIEVPVWEYRHGSRRIWGATAAILNSLRSSLT